MNDLEVKILQMLKYNQDYHHPIRCNKIYSFLNNNPFYSIKIHHDER